MAFKEVGDLANLQILTYHPQREGLLVYEQTLSLEAQRAIGPLEKPFQSDMMMGISFSG